MQCTLMPSYRLSTGLGLSQWDGIEQDIAWGHVTSLMGLLRPSLNGPIFVYRVPCRIGGQSSSQNSSYDHDHLWTGTHPGRDRCPL